MASFLEKARNLRQGFLRIFGEDDAIAVLGGIDDIINDDMLQPEFAQFQLFDHLGVQMPHNKSEGGGPKTRRELFCDGPTADDMTALQYQRFQASPGKIGAAGESVVACADYDGIISISHKSYLEYLYLNRLRFYIIILYLEKMLKMTGIYQKKL